MSFLFKSSFQPAMGDHLTSNFTRLDMHFQTQPEDLK